MLDQRLQGDSLVQHEQVMVLYSSSYLLWFATGFAGISTIYADAVVLLTLDALEMLSPEANLLPLVIMQTYELLGMPGSFCYC